MKIILIALTALVPALAFADAGSSGPAPASDASPDSRAANLAAVTARVQAARNARLAAQAGVGGPCGGENTPLTLSPDVRGYPPPPPPPDGADYMNVTHFTNWSDQDTSALPLPSSVPQTIDWAPSFGAAVSRAAAQGKLVMLQIGSPACGNNTATNENLGSSKVSPTLNQKAVSSYVDGTKASMFELWAKYKGCTCHGCGYPMLCFIDPKTCEIVRMTNSFIDQLSAERLVRELPAPGTSSAAASTPAAASAQPAATHASAALPQAAVPSVAPASGPAASSANPMDPYVRAGEEAAAEPELLR